MCVIKRSYKIESKSLEINISIIELEKKKIMIQNSKKKKLFHPLTKFEFKIYEVYYEFILNNWEM